MIQKNSSLQNCKSETQALKFRDEDLRTKSKKELIQTIQYLSIENRRLSAIITNQEERSGKLSNHSFHHAPNELNLTRNFHEESTLLSMLESMEEAPARKEQSVVHRTLANALLNANSKSYSIVNSILVGLIIFSVICVIMESVPSLLEKWGIFFYWSELIVVGLFSIEYLINIYVAEDKIRYIFGPWGLIDLMAILPTYLYMVDLRDIKLARILRIIRFLRTLRMIRVLKLTKNISDKYEKSTKQQENTLKIDLQIYATALFTVIIIFSTLIYYAERHVPGTPFTNIPAAMWWCLVTITTVGYGDMHPSTIMGKFVAAVVMIIGLALFGILMNVIGKAMMASISKTSKMDR